MNDQFSYNLDAFYEGGPKTWNDAFPPVCIKSHWDPTQITQHVLPSHLIAPQQFDPRQSVKICTSYYNLSEKENSVRVYPAWEPTSRPAELQNTQTYSESEEFKKQFTIHDVGNNTNANALLGPDYYKRSFYSGQIAATPPGGAAGNGAPYSLYANSINQESDLYRLNEPMTKCKERRHIPTDGPAEATNTLPHISQVFGLSPHAMYVAETTGCRETDDEAAWNRSGRLFFNHTRLDRVYSRPHGPLACRKTA